MKKFSRGPSGQITFYLNCGKMDNNSLRILHILSGDLWAGAEVMAYQLLKDLHLNKNCSLMVVVLNQGQAASKLRHEGIQVKVLEESRCSFPSLIAGVRHIIRIFKPNVVHAHRYKENILAFSASRGIKKVNLVSTQHGMPETHTKGSTLRNRLIRWTNFFILNRFFESLVAVSWDMKNALVAKGFASQKISVIHNGMELPQHFQPTNSQNHLVVGSCGRLFPVKNYELFIEIAARVTKQMPEIQFMLAGDGPEMEKLRLQCSKAGLDGNFTFLGHMQDMQSFYRKLDLFMSTSLHEGIPMSVLEAMGHGLPIVAPRVGGFPEIIDDGIEGILVPRHDPNLFVQACLQLYSDSKVWSIFSKNARMKIESKFSSQGMTTNYINLYQALAA